jgi:hypothetical protein
MRLIALIVVAVSMLAAGRASTAAERVEARLVGHVILPALTLIAPPPDAPPALRSSGRLIDPGAASAGAGSDADGGGRIVPPFAGQPVKSFSGVRHVGEGLYWTPSDNGFGRRSNSSDAMLMAHLARPDWAAGTLEILQTLFLRDPDRVLPFRLTFEDSAARYLTGADLDIEAVEILDGRLWFGDEFGPFLASADLEGRIRSIHPLTRDGRVLRSPDHPDLRALEDPAAEDVDVARSRGLEGLARRPGGPMLLAMLEGPIRGGEGAAGRAAPILEFDTRSARFTGRRWTYPLEQPRHAIGDFAMISATRGLVIERDSGQGDAARACAAGASGPDCFARPARFKRLYLIGLDAAGGAVAKLAYVDLLDIADPDGVARSGPGGDRFAFPFVTVEAVDRVDDTRVILSNDNNLPFSTGRLPGVPDDSEWILLEVGDLLRR